MRQATPIVTKADRTRQHIIERSAHLFNTKGYAGTSLQDIMAATGLTKGGIYGHFTSKEDIALASFEHATNNILSLMRERTALHTSAGKKLEAILDFYKNYTLSPPIAGGCPVLNTATEADDTNPLLRASVVRVLNILHKSLAAIVQQGMKQGEFKPSANPARFAILFISMLEGAIMVTKAYGDPKYINTILQHLQHLIDSDLKA